MGREREGVRKRQGREIKVGSQGAIAKTSELKAENEATKRSSKEACLQIYRSLFKCWLLL